MENKKCCFCGKELQQNDWNNPEPLNSDEGTVCCTDCDKELVRAVRGVTWRPWVSREMQNNLLAYFKSLSIEELRHILPKELRMMISNEWELYITLLRSHGAKV